MPPGTLQWWPGPPVLVTAETARGVVAGAGAEPENRRVERSGAGILADLGSTPPNKHTFNMYRSIRPVKNGSCQVISLPYED